LKAKTTERWIVFFVFFFAVLIANSIREAAASDDKRTNVDVNTEVSTEVNTGPVNVTTGSNTFNGGDNSVGGSRALALGNSLGDVDIAGCLGSTQWATPVYSRQKLSTNWACLAEFYLRAEKYDLAAMAMCNTDVRSEFDTETACREAHDFTPAYVAPIIIDTSEDEEYHDKYEQQFQAQQTMIDELQAQINRPAIRPTTVIQKTEFLDAEKRAKLEALRGDK